MPNTGGRGVLGLRRPWSFCVLWIQRLPLQPSFRHTVLKLDQLVSKELVGPSLWLAPKRKSQTLLVFLYPGL